MTLVTRVVSSMNINYDTNAPISQDGVRPAVQDAPLWTFIEQPHVAGEYIDAGRPCYQRPSDGKWYQCIAVDGTHAADNVVAWSFQFSPAGGMLALVHEYTNFGYSDGTAPQGRPLYLSVVKGNLDTAPAYNGQLPCAYSNDGYNIKCKGFVWQNYNGT